MTDAAAFAAVEAIKAGEWDRALVPLLATVRERMALIDPSKPPRMTPEMIASGHQVWVWMNGPGTPHWEVRGTGALPEEDRA